MKHTDNISRRNLLRGVARGAVGVAIAAVALVLGRRSSLPSQDCTGRFICRSCTALGDCALPQAMSLKEAMNTDHRGAENTEEKKNG